MTSLERPRLKIVSLLTLFKLGYNYYGGNVWVGNVEFRPNRDNVFVENDRI